MPDQINLEIYTNGKPRLFYKTGGVSYSYTFKTDIRSDKPVHMALTVDGLTVTLYVDGVKKETTTLTVPLPAVTSGFMIGCDNRTGTPQYFAGTIYSVTLYSGVRTAEQIAVDRYMPPLNGDGLLLDKFFTAQ